MDIEVITMDSPHGQGHQIHINNIIWEDSKEFLEFELEKIFSAFGLINHIIVQQYFDEERGDYWFSYITFYSKRAARSAIQQSGKLNLRGQLLTVRKASARPSKKFPLQLEKAQNLLTYYFGFNCWTSDVVFMDRESEPAEPNTVQYLCMVRVKMPKEGLCSEGLGLANVPLENNSPASKGTTIACCQKFAFHSAMRSAFLKFIIIVLGNGKVTVEVDTTQQDPLIYNPAWDNPLIQVRDIIFDPEEEEECDDIEGLTEEQLEELLNQPL